MYRLNLKKDLYAYYVLTLLALSPLSVSAKWTKVSKVEGVPTSFDSAVMNIINYILGFIGAIAVLVLIWGGVQYLTSSGNQDMVNSGKNTIKNGLIGLVIAGLAYAIVNVVIAEILN